MKVEISTIALSPEGSLYLLPSEIESVPLRIQTAFAISPGNGLKQLGLWELETALPPDLGYWRDFSRLYFSHLCSLPSAFPELTNSSADQQVNGPQSESANSSRQGSFDQSVQTPQKSFLLPPPAEELEEFSQSAPPFLGGEYLNEKTLAALWKMLHTSFLEEVQRTEGTIQAFFSKHKIAWNLVGRVCFHLAENKGNEETPFAFLATYSHKLSTEGKVRHLPLGKALQEYAGEKNKDRLLQLLLPVQKGTEKSKFLKSLVDSGEIFHPLAWTSGEAFQFLKDIPYFESSGITVRIPDWWKPKNPPRPQVSVTIGGKKNSIFGLDAMLKFSVELTLDGEQLTSKEIKEILSSTSGLALIRGRWVEIDREKLTQVLDHWKSVEEASTDGEISFIDGMRLLSGASALENPDSSLVDTSHEWTKIGASEDLTLLLDQLKDPAGKLKVELGLSNELRATLRPYQTVGVKWLWFLGRLGLGACLADDMGLGKTIQIISLFLLLKRDQKSQKPPNLLIVPASLLGNWKSEIERFAPSLQLAIAHPSGGASFGAFSSEQGSSRSEMFAADVIMTTYGYLTRQSYFTETSWNCIVIDEAQAIKNAGSKQARAVKSLKGKHRIALTGTPVENHLSDLWSLYDFLCPGLLGSAKTFTSFVKGTEKGKTEKVNAQENNNSSGNRYAALRNLVRPYLLRRLKTDKSIISDLPDKTEVQAYCPLSKTQAVLYQQSVEELAQKIKHLEGIQRRGVVLSFLMRFKQICNHPSQWLSDGHYDPVDSGKFGRLMEICEDIVAKQEKVLIFTQFREMTKPLSQYLQSIFGKPGFVLHGETAVKKRKELVDAFQEDPGAQFFVLSLKAGGTGLNLTAASHVIHFDRWWNPAVENQATDRAYRIGQGRNVLVHKFISRGTIEERIDSLISSKQSLSDEILEKNGETLLTELGNEELLKLVSLDIQSAIEEV